MPRSQLLFYYISFLSSSLFVSPVLCARTDVYFPLFQFDVNLLRETVRSRVSGDILDCVVLWKLGNVFQSSVTRIGYTTQKVILYLTKSDH